MNHTGARLDAPAFHRNHGPIGDVLCARLGGVTGHALEIGSGTGQHVVRFAARLPDLVWWPSDPDPAHRRSIEAWREHASVSNVKPPLLLEANRQPWTLGAPGWPPNLIQIILALNVAHITPWKVTEGILRGAGQHLLEDGWLFVYGPFKREGRHTAESNARFDESLRARDPEWGVRDIADLESCAAENGLAVEEIVQMPANNLILIFRP